jgi:hypothetical protein
VLETCCWAGGKLLLKLRVSKAIFWPRSGVVLASFVASSGTYDLRPTWGLTSNVPPGEFDALFEEQHNLATEIGCRNNELRCKPEPHRFVAKTYMNHAFALCFEPKDDIS